MVNGMQTELDTSEQQGATEPQAPSTQRGFVAEWAVTILVLLFASTSLAWSYVIPTGSMENTLLIGDHIIVDKLAYAPAGAVSKYFLPYEEPKHGDIIAFRFPADISQMFVKRVIGVPGDRLKLIDGVVYRNGVALKESYVIHKSSYPDTYRDNFPNVSSSLNLYANSRQEFLLREVLQRHVVNGEVIVPPGRYFAMGDNRDNSLDSRYWGFVPRENIVGKPILIYWSYNASTDELMPSSAGDFGRHLLDVGQHFFSRTRWDRTLHLVRGIPDQP